VKALYVRGETLNFLNRSAETLLFVNQKRTALQKTGVNQHLKTGYVLYETASLGSGFGQSDAQRPRGRFLSSLLGRKGRRVPIEPQFAQLFTDAPQIPDLDLCIPLVREEFRPVG
jgi:hypothetical protein